MTDEKAAGAVDRRLGERVRMRRLEIGMSQECLAGLVGITFQQVQKYEKGTNRIGASRLSQISDILTVPVSYFFEGAPAQQPGGGGFSEGTSTYVVDFLSTTEGLQLNKAFTRINDPKVRRKVVELVKALAGDEEAA